jgi:hypothetical protein
MEMFYNMVKPAEGDLDEGSGSDDDEEHDTSGSNKKQKLISDAKKEEFA